MDIRQGANFLRGERVQGETTQHPFRTLPQHVDNPLMASFLERPRQKESEKLEFEKFPAPTTFSYWKLNFRSALRSNPIFSHALTWMGEIASAK